MAWDDGKLEALRGKYGESHGGELFDPKFRRVADKIFSKSGTRLAPYAGVPTFLTAPYLLQDLQELLPLRHAAVDHRRHGRSAGR